MPTTIGLTAHDLRFDPETHRSVAPDGHDVPHVTHILSAVGVAADFEALAQESRRLAGILDYRRDLGTAVHADCHAYDDGDLAWDTVHAEVLPFVRAWDACRTALGLEPQTRERRVYHPQHDYTGILDGVFLRGVARGRHRRILLDLKIGDPEDAGARWQLAAYEGAWVAEHPDQPVDERWAIQLCPLLRVPYRVTNYSAQSGAHRDFSVFLAFLTTYRHQLARVIA